MLQEKPRAAHRTSSISTRWLKKKNRFLLISKLATTHYILQYNHVITRVIAVSCGIKKSAVHHLVLSQHTRLTDRQTYGQTDRIATAIPCVALCSRTLKTSFSALRQIRPSKYSGIVSKRGKEEGCSLHRRVAQCL